MKRGLLVLAACAGCWSKPGFAFQDGGAGGDGQLFNQLVFTKLGAGGHHACGIASGQLWCWGRNLNGQLGNRGEARSGDPGLATADGDWTDVAAGDEHTCGIRAGRIFCWGRNEGGQVAPLAPSASEPQTELPLGGLVPAPTAPASVFAGGDTSCMIDSSGQLYCWGLVNGDMSPMFVNVPGSVAFSSVAIASDHACALATDGTAYCWGQNDVRQLADPGSLALHPHGSAFAVGGYAFVALGASQGVTCGVTTAGALVCWGSTAGGHFADQDGGLPVRVPTVIATTPKWSTLAVGPAHVCALAAGSVYCYGSDDNGALGDGTFDNRRTLGTAIVTGMASVFAGYGYSCALASSTSTASCWGSDADGELGNRQVATKTSPTTVHLPALGVSESILEVRAGISHTCALVGAQGGDGKVYCWGDGSDYQVDGKTRPVAASTPTELGIPLAHISAGNAHNCGITASADTAVCWGDNSAQQLAKMGPSGTNTITGVTGWTSIAAGGRMSCGTTTLGDLHCWGDVLADAMRASPVNYGHQTSREWRSVSIGDSFVVGVAFDPMSGDPTYAHVVEFANDCRMLAGTPALPIDIDLGAIVSTPSVAAAHANGFHACAFFGTASQGAAPEVSCWGKNDSHEVDPTGNTCLLAKPAAPPNGWLAPATGAAIVATASDQSCALDRDGKLACWGGNSRGELGSNPDVSTTAVVAAGAYSEIAMGAYHTCVVAMDRKSVSCMGENKQGQIGDGTQFQPAPVPAGLIP